MDKLDLRVTGTLIWYYQICHRQVWLMAHQLTPDGDNSFIEIGRYIDRNSYKRTKKQFRMDSLVIDLVENNKGQIVVGEVKKSSGSLKGAEKQLLFYLMKLEEKGISVQGEIRVPQEKRRYSVYLTVDKREEILADVRGILKIIDQSLPPEPKKSTYCRNCGYREFCWS